MEGMTEKHLLEKARSALGLMPSGGVAPSGATFVGVQLLRGGGALLHMNDGTAVQWLKANMEEFLTRMGGMSVYKERLCNVVLRFVPVSFDPVAEGALKVVSEDNGLPKGALVKARWIKPLERRRPGQRVAHAVLGFSDPSAANRVIRDGVWIDGSKVHGYKLLSEPVRCLKCQRIGAGHIAADCKNDHEVCAQCGEDHRTSTCAVTDEERACTNCKVAKLDHKGHGAADHTCPFFKDKLHHSLGRNSDAPYPYFLVSKDPSSWVTNEESGNTYVPNASVPERRAASQRDLGPGPRGRTAQQGNTTRSGAAGGGQSGTLQGGEAGLWGLTQTTLDTHFALDPRTHPHRAALMTPPATNEEGEGESGETGLAEGADATAPAPTELRPIDEEDEVELLIERTSTMTVPLAPERVDELNV
jgi:hypothetical protein